MATIAKVVVSDATYAIDRPYDYEVPASLCERARPGMRVLISFGGGSRRTDGVILAMTVGEVSPGIKRLIALLDDEPMLSEEALQLALWMRQQYFCTVYDVVRVMLPAGLWFQLKDCWLIADGVDRERAYEGAGKSGRARRLVELLFANGRAADVAQIRAAFGTEDPMPAIRRLADRQIIRLETSVSRGIGDKTEKMARLALAPEEALEAVAPKRRRAPLQYAVVEQLAVLGGASVKELCYFTGASMSTMRALERQGLILMEKQEVFRRPERLLVGERSEIILNGEQQAAFEGLSALLRQDGASAALLYGVTGSGKTQVYMKLIFEVLSQGKGALMLVPEIALTPQLMRKFASCFGDQVAIMHSMLSAGERYDEWKRIRRGEAKVVVGTRSAVFSPVPDLGLIILDEEQEASYKSEQEPRYHARDVAKWRCAREGALLLMGSATPSVESMHLAKEGIYHLFTLSRRYNEGTLPDVTVVDMKNELRQGNGGIISRALAGALEETVKRGEQAILLLNRRGANKMVSCGECGQVPACPRCSVHLTYHSANRRLMCHYCGHSQSMPEHCPECGGLLNFVGAGTQMVEEELKRLLPQATVIRMDADTVTATRTHERILSEFQKSRGAILVGTQMVAKGLDFEGVTLVGVAAADQSLYLDDFRAGERTFSLLTQVVGRAGRGKHSGRAFIQTYTPENEIIRCAARQDYDSFYEQEIALRRMNGYPPFEDLFTLMFSGTEESAVLSGCMRAREFLSSAFQKGAYRDVSHRLLGPAPAAIVKINNRFRYRLVLGTRNTAQIRELISHLLRQMQKDKSHRGVSITADVNPMD